MPFGMATVYKRIYLNENRMMPAIGPDLTVILNGIQIDPVLYRGEYKCMSSISNVNPVPFAEFITKCSASLFISHFNVELNKKWPKQRFQSLESSKANPNGTFDLFFKGSKIDLHIRLLSDADIHHPTAAYAVVCDCTPSHDTSNWICIIS